MNEIPQKIKRYLEKLKLTPEISTPFFISSRKNQKCEIFNKKIGGIYLIIGNFKSDFVEYPIYIGGSCAAPDRIRDHFIHLVRNKHKNQVLQRSFNKESGKFYALLLETCERDKVIEREQFYLDTIRPFLSEGRGYNMEKKAKRLDFPNRLPLKEESKKKIAEKNSRPFEIIDPKGDLIKGSNLTEFCRLNDLEAPLLCAVINGRRKCHKGYRKNIPKHLGKTFDKKIQKRLFRATLIDDMGNKFFVKSLRGFARDMGLKYNKLNRELRLYKKSGIYKLHE